MTMLYTWAARWGVPLEAVQDLQARMGLTQAETYTPGSVEGGEAAVQVRVRLDAAKAGIMLWRNNVGALQDPTGRWVRYGLCNDSKALNEKVKSGDLIGIKRVTIEPHMVGQVIGQFVSREVKKEGWKYTGTGREPAQLRWAELVIGAGGDAGFVS